MLSLLRGTRLCVQSVGRRSRGVPCLCLPRWLKEAQRRGRTLALVVLLLLTVVLVAACAPPSTVSPPEPATRPPVGSNPGLLPQYAGQELEFERICVEHGLSQSTVSCVLQDRLGFMWFCTQEGLNRHDGYGFKVYTHDPQNPNSLSHSQVTALVEDEEGNLWIATYGGGLDKLNRQTEMFTHFRNEPGNLDSLADDRLNALLMDGNGVLWIGTVAGLDRFEPQVGRFTHYQPAAAQARGAPQSLSGWSVESLYQDSDGWLWIGTNSEGLYRLDPVTGVFANFSLDAGDFDCLSDNTPVRSIVEDRHGTLWIGTMDGLSQLDRQTGRVVRYRHQPEDPNSLSNDLVSSILEDAAGVLWIGTYGGGLDRLDPATGQLAHYRNIPNDPSSLSNNAILSIYQDRVGVLWIGTAGGGISKLSSDTKRFVRVQNDPTNPDSLSNNTVRAILEDRGVLWIGTLGGGLDRFDRETNEWRHYRYDPGDPYSLSNNNVTSLCKDQEGALWIGTLGGGLNRLDWKNERFLHYPTDPRDAQTLGTPAVYALLSDRQGDLWIGTDAGPTGGLHRFDPQTESFAHYKHDPDSPLTTADAGVQILHEDRSGALWVGTFGAGLSRLDRSTGRFTHYENQPGDPSSLSHDEVTAICEDRAGVLWVGTDGGGLNRFNRDQETFVHYTVEDGLPGNTISGILEEDAALSSEPDGGPEVLWISTNNGLSKFDPGAATFRNYDVRDGLQGNVFSVGADFNSSSGEMYFGGTNGLNVFYPEQIVDNPTMPPVVLTSLTQLTRNGEDVTVGTLAEGARQIVFEWPNNAFEFEFAALNYIQPDKNQHAYMLEGFDEGWNYVGTRRYGRYTNLPAGTYTLHMMGSNNDGIWNEAGASVTITVSPPFWRTWWFRGIVLLVLVGVAFGAHRLRVRSIEARSRELEKQVAERTAELSQEIDQRIQVEEALRQSEREKAVVSERNRLARELHDSVAQSMYGLVLLAEVASQLLSSGQADPVASYLGEVKDTAQESLAEMRLLIYELRPPVLEEEGLASALQTRLEAVESRAGLKTEFHLEGQISLSSEVEEVLYRIAQEALNNVLKHAQARRVAVSLRQDAHTGTEPVRVTLEVTDDGIGLDPVRARQGGGMGLRGMEDRAAEIGARLEIESAAGSGTTVRVVWEDDE